MMTTRVRQLAEIGAPGAAIGVISGTVVGAMSLFAGFPVSWAVVGVLTLGVPLALLGGTYGVMVALGYFKPGTFTPAALFWLVGFPVSRLVHETLTPVVLGGSPTPPADIPTFLIFQGLVSMGFAIGFVWMFERTTPPWLVSIKDHNPAAAQLYTRYAHHAAAVWEARERKLARRSLQLGKQPATAAAGARGRSRRSV
jgi:hypothetical protein